MSNPFTRLFQAMFLVCVSYRSAVAQGVITTTVGTDWLFPSTVAAATNAPMGGGVYGVAVDQHGNFYAADWTNHIVVMVTSSGALTTVAGNGIAGYSGDGGLATGVPLEDPYDVTLDAAGNLYVLDYERVRKITPNGIICTVAGGGSLSGQDADGKRATDASLSTSLDNGIALDAAGNLYIGEYFANRVRKVTLDGIITTVAGNGTRGFSGDGGPAVQASLNYPTGVAVDSSGNLYIADNINHRVREVTPDGMITTVAEGIAQPTRLAVDQAGNLYIGEYFTRIYKMARDGSLTTVVGSGSFGFSGDGGPATQASISWPRGLALDAKGSIYFADSGNKRIRMVAPSGIISTVAGDGVYRYSADGTPATSAWLDSPEAMATDQSGNVLIADTAAERIRKVTTNGQFFTIAGNDIGSVGSNPALSFRFNHPSDIALDASGDLYIAGIQNVYKVTPDGSVSTVAGTGGCTTPISLPDAPVPAKALQFCGPLGVAVDPANTLYLVDTSAHVVWKVTSDGTATRFAGTGNSGFSGDGGPAVSAALSYPSRAALDPAGNLYISDSSNNRIRKVSATGVISSVAGNGRYAFSGDGGPAISASLAYPHGITLDRAGNLYIADAVNNRIRRVTPDGTISTVAGDGANAFAGDGGPATSASLSDPNDVAVDFAGNIYIADTGNNRIREVLFSNGVSSSVSQDHNGQRPTLYHFVEGSPPAIVPKPALLRNTTTAPLRDHLDDGRPLLVLKPNL